jgi:hypothetical protein
MEIIRKIFNFFQARKLKNYRKIDEYTLKNKKGEIEKWEIWQKL